MENPASAYRPTPEASPTASAHNITHGVLGILDLRPVANQVGGADDAEGARQAGADDQHDDGADDREDDLRLDHRRIALRRAAAARPQRQRRTERRGERQPHHRIVDLVQRVRRMVVGVAALVALEAGLRCGVTRDPGIGQRR